MTTVSFANFDNYEVEFVVEKAIRLTDEVVDAQINFNQPYQVKVVITYRPPVALWDNYLQSIIQTTANEYYLKTDFKTRQEAEHFCHKASKRVFADLLN